ncbi:hypothetical protein [Lelliottia aquatilis]|uniref:hypothetical protein n=1 Tax=Lelliottia aquatilis TaxID=2080838 RepID=UPI0010575C58|nr:hypothetical protein [Lelliottia aquatilis]
MKIKMDYYLSTSIISLIKRMRFLFEFLLSSVSVFSRVKIDSALFFFILLSYGGDAYASRDINIVNNSHNTITLSNFLGRCTSPGYDNVNIPPGNKKIISWDVKSSLFHDRCGWVEPDYVYTAWLTFKVTSIVNKESRTENLGMATKPVMCKIVFGGTECDHYNDALFYAEEINDAPTDDTKDPLPSDYKDGDLPYYITASCNSIRGQNCMGPFSKVVQWEDNDNIYWSDKNNEEWTFTINDPVADIKLINPKENAHLITFEGMGVDVSGTAEPEKKIEYGYDGGSATVVTVGADGKWSGSISTNSLLKPDGSITKDVNIYARYKDVVNPPAQDMRKISIARGVTVNPAGQPDTGSYSFDGIASLGSHLDYSLCSDKGQPCTKGKIPASHLKNWSVDVSLPDSSGIYDFNVIQHLDDFPDSTAMVGVYTKAQDVRLTINIPKEGAHYSVSDYITPAGNVDGGLTVQYRIDRGANQLASLDHGTWQGEPGQYLPGAHTITVTATGGKPGGASAPESYDETNNFIVDAATPVVIDYPANNQLLPPADTLTVTGKAELSATVVCQLDGHPGTLPSTVTKEGRFTCTLNIKDATGKHTVTVMQMINGQAFGQDSHDFSVARPLTMTTPAEGGSVLENTRYPVGGSGEPGADVEVRIDDWTVIKTKVDSTGQWGIHVPDSGAARYAITATGKINGTLVNSLCQEVSVINKRSPADSANTGLCKKDVISSNSKDNK